MNALRRAVVLALAVLLLAIPSASAVGFTFLADRHIEGRPDAEGIARYELPIRVEESGYLYVKLLATDGNAIHDGSRANGSVRDGTGWRADLALRFADGRNVTLGTFVDGTPSDTVEVVAGEELALTGALHVPANAAQSGERQTVYVAVAWRSEPIGTTSGASSGASMDQARAATFIVLLDGAVPVTDTGSIPAPTPVFGGDTGGETTTTPTPDPVESTPPDGSSDPGPVQPIETGDTVRVIVEQAALPTWFLAIGLALLAGVLVALVAILVALRHIVSAGRAGAPASTTRTLGVERAADEASSRAIPVEER